MQMYALGRPLSNIVIVSDFSSNAVTGTIMEVGGGVWDGRTNISQLG